MIPNLLDAMLSSEGTVLKQDPPMRHVWRQIIIKIVLGIAVLAFGLIVIQSSLNSYIVPLFPGATLVSTTFNTNGYEITRTYNLGSDTIIAS